MKIPGKARSTKQAYALLPKAILKHPPIAHRGQPRDGLLEPFEAAVLAAIVAKARSQGLAPERHQYARERSQRAMQRKRAKYIEKDKWQRDLMFDEARRRNGDPIDHDFVAAGKTAYREAVRSFRRRQRTTAVPITLTRAALLRLAGLSCKAGNYTRLDAALVRLQQPVRAGPTQLPPLLQSAPRLGGGKLALLVEPAWFPHDVGRLPLPLPTKGDGSTTAALFLFLAGIDTRRDSWSRARIRRTALYQLVGISQKTKQRRALHAALAQINKHLKDLKWPTTYDIVPIGDGEWLRCAVRKPSAAIVDDELHELRKLRAMPMPQPEPVASRHNANERRRLREADLRLMEEMRQWYVQE
jgi:hypothetical protein